MDAVKEEINRSRYEKNRIKVTENRQARSTSKGQANKVKDELSNKKDIKRVKQRQE